MDQAIPAVGAGTVCCSHSIAGAGGCSSAKSIPGLLCVQEQQAVRYLPALRRLQVVFRGVGRPAGLSHSLLPS